MRKVSVFQFPFSYETALNVPNNPNNTIIFHIILSGKPHINHIIKQSILNLYT